MKSKVLSILIVSILIILCIDFPISNSNILGSYTNNNFDQEPFYAEIPYSKDTLSLKENGEYESSYYGKGDYTIELRLILNKIQIENREFKVSRKLFRPTKIILVNDLNYYYQKVN